LIKDFNSFDLEIERIPLKAAYIYTPYPFNSTYKPLKNGFNNINDRGIVQTLIPK